MKKQFVSLLGLALALCASTVLAANEIKFHKVSSTVASAYGQHTQTINIEATVLNLAYDKGVYAHLRQNNGRWDDIPLTYNRSIAGNREIWKLVYQPPTNTTFNVVFALKYVVNGQTYWDNNGGANYTIAEDSGSRLAGGINVYNSNWQSNIILPSGYPSFNVVATLRNLAFAKTVRIHYSTNNWATVQRLNASYSPYFWSGAYSSATNPNAYGFEEWSASLNIGNATQVDYAIEYVVNGQTFWDNNFGLNYHSTITRQ